MFSKPLIDASQVKWLVVLVYPFSVFIPTLCGIKAFSIKQKDSYYTMLLPTVHCMPHGKHQKRNVAVESVRRSSALSDMLLRSKSFLNGIRSAMCPSCKIAIQTSAQLCKVYRFLTLVTPNTCAQLAFQILTSTTFIWMRVLMKTRNESFAGVYMYLTEDMHRDDCTANEKRIVPIKV